MTFFKKLFESKTLSLDELVDLHARDGMYKGEILNALKSRVLFIALPQAPSGPINFEYPTTQYLILDSPVHRGFIVPVFMDQVTLSQRDNKLLPHMVEFKTLAKIFENQFCLGIMLCTSKVDQLYTRQDLSRVLPSVKVPD